MKLRNTGDTIVEVLIAIAIMGVVLAGAYASASRSLNANRRAQEHTEAMRVAEQQLELMKASARAGNTIFANAPNFCLDSGGNWFEVEGVVPPNYLNDDYTSTASGGNYPDECRVTFSGGGYYYYAWVQRAGTDTFTVRVRWDGAGGLKQETSLIYRLYNEST